MAWGSSPTVGTYDSDDGDATTLSLTPGAPSGSGGVLLCLVSSRNVPTTFSVPTGWTEITGTESHRNAVFARVATGGADDTPTVQVVVGAATCVAAVLTRWTGGNETLGSMLDGTVQTDSSVAPGGIDVPAITPSVDNCLVLRGGFTRWADDGPAFAPPSGDTLLCETQHVSGYGEDFWNAWVYRIQTTAATVSAGQIDNNTTSDDSYSIAVALTAAAASTLQAFQYQTRTNTLLRM